MATSHNTCWAEKERTSPCRRLGAAVRRRLAAAASRYRALRGRPTTPAGQLTHPAGHYHGEAARNGQARPGQDSLKRCLPAAPRRTALALFTLLVRR